MSHRRVDGRGRYGKEYGNSLVGRRERDEPMRREGLQARGSYKEVPEDPLHYRTKAEESVYKLSLAINKRAVNYKVKVII